MSVTNIQINPELKSFINKYFNELKFIMEAIDHTQIEKTISILDKARERGNRVYVIGNGGSAATASHIACDLSKGTLAKFNRKREKRFRVMSMTENVPLITALANDLSYNNIFLQQLWNLVEKDDILLVLSGSGNSRNLIKTVKYAKERGTITIGLLGFQDGGRLAKLVDHPIIIKSNRYGPIEDMHLVLGHVITAWFASIISK